MHPVASGILHIHTCSLHTYMCECLWFDNTVKPLWLYNYSISLTLARIMCRINEVVGL